MDETKQTYINRLTQQPYTEADRAIMGSFAQNMTYLDLVQFVHSRTTEEERAELVQNMRNQLAFEHYVTVYDAVVAGHEADVESNHN